MGFLYILLIAVSLSMDAFAVSVSNGLSIKEIRKSEIFLEALFFGGFQFLMPVLGFLLGFSVKGYIEAFDHWIAFALLGLIGFNMVKESLGGDDEDECEQRQALTPTKLLFQAIATSIDALAVGVSFAFLNVHIIPLCLSIAIITFVLCFIGVMIGSFLGPIFKNYSQIFGGIILILIGINILNEHTNFIYLMLH